MFKVLRALLRRLFNSSPNTHNRAQLGTNGTQTESREDSDTIDSADGCKKTAFISSDASITPEACGLAYDKTLLERSYTQWQFGDWGSLCQLNDELINGHPDRAKLALLAAAGHLQVGQQQEAECLTDLAQSWGASKKLISQILISGVHNSLGRAAAISQQPKRAELHFQSAVTIGLPGADAKLLAPARMSNQISDLGLGLPKDLNRLDESQQSIASNEKIKDGQAQREKSNQQTKKFSSDADIDDFINDIAPFFSGRSIVYLDVGAYIGEVYLKLLQSGKIIICEAHLIEPNPDSYKKLLDSIKHSNLDSTVTYNIAISNTPEKAIFKAARSMTKRVRDVKSTQNNKDLFEIESKKLDELFNSVTEWSSVLMKLDVEGEELDVLKSAEKLIEKQKIDVIYVEVGFNRCGTQQTYFGDLDALLQSNGYRAFKIYEQKNEWMEDSPLLRRCNVAYMSHAFSSANLFSETYKNTLKKD